MEKEKISSDKAIEEAKILNIKKMEEASRNENQKEFYKALNENIGVKSRNKTFTSTQIISQIEDSNGIMEPETRSNLLDDLKKQLDYDEEDDKPTYEEVAKGFKDMKNGKAPGSDGIASETLKFSPCNHCF